MFRHPEYKDSGIEWIGEIPSHWSSIRLKNIVTFNDEVLPEDTDPEFEFWYVEISDVDEFAGIAIRKKLLFSEAPSRARRVLRVNDILVSTVRTYLRAIGTIPETEDILVASTGFCVLRATSRFFWSYLSYFVKTDYFVSAVVANSEGVSYPAINSTDLVKLRAVLPPFEEQIEISGFLDKRTSKIDSLTEKLEQKIELLKEYRTSLIGQCVTKGLDPDAEMKDSGIEWIGEIPIHWALRRLKFICRFAYGDSLSVDERVYGDIPVYGSNGQIDSHQESNTLGECLIIGRKGSYGKVHYVSDSAFAIDTTFFVGRNQTSTNISWLYYLLELIRLDELSRDSAVPGLNREEAYQKIGVYPLLHEQISIANYLDRKTSQIDFLIEKLQQKIELLKEYRQSLISNVVTGKIRVAENVE